jgi:hypothetical protein
LGPYFGETQQAVLKHQIHILDVCEGSCEGPTSK